jgi:hypothetical protein
MSLRSSSWADMICHRCGEPMYYAPLGNQFVRRAASYCSVLETRSPDGEICVWVCAEINSLNAYDGPRPEWADPQPVIDRIDELVNESLDAGWRAMK